MVGRDSRCGAATRLRGVRCARRRGLRRVPGTAGQDGGVRYAGHIHRSGIRVRMVWGRGAPGDPGVEGPSRRGVRRAVVRGDGRAGRPVPAGDGDGMRTVLVVPAPSSSASVHRRGRRHTAVLAAAVARACRDMGIDARVVPLLTMDHVRGRSVQMGGGQRSRRVSGRIAVRRPELCRHAHVIVVDDIVTTGATMRQCVDALRSSGAQVVTCLSVAYTPQPDAATVRDSAARDDTSAA